MKIAGRPTVHLVALNPRSHTRNTICSKGISQLQASSTGTCMGNNKTSSKHIASALGNTNSTCNSENTLWTSNAEEGVIPLRNEGPKLVQKNMYAPGHHNYEVHEHGQPHEKTEVCHGLNGRYQVGEKGGGSSDSGHKHTLSRDL